MCEEGGEVRKRSRLDQESKFALIVGMLEGRAEGFFWYDDGIAVVVGGLEDIRRARVGASCQFSSFMLREG